MSAEDAEAYHRFQVGVLAGAGVDMSVLRRFGSAVILFLYNFRGLRRAEHNVPTHIILTWNKTLRPEYRQQKFWPHFISCCFLIFFCWQKVTTATNKFKFLFPSPKKYFFFGLRTCQRHVENLSAIIYIQFHSPLVARVRDGSRRWAWRTPPRRSAWCAAPTPPLRCGVHPRKTGVHTIIAISHWCRFTPRLTSNGYPLCRFGLIGERGRTNDNLFGLASSCFLGWFLGGRV